MKVVVEGGATVTLRASDFVAQGGEGRIWARKGVAYKVYLDPARGLGLDKIAALAAIDCDDVVVPQRRLLDPATGSPVGYTMRHVAGAWVLGQLFARSFCDRQGFDVPAAGALIDAMRRALAAVHRAGVLVVDLSDVNVLVGPRDHRPAFIDSDSWQTPGHPATAVTPATCDPRVATFGFDEGSDWFSFAVLTFQLLVGIHPFRGKHATVKGLAARMAAGLSVLDPSVAVPPACRDLAVIPRAYRDWYEAVFVHGRREPPPLAMQAAGTGLTTLPRAGSGGATALCADALGLATARIRQVLPEPHGGPLWLYTDAGVQRGAGGPVVHAASPRGATEVLGLAPASGAWVVATVDDDAGGLHFAADRVVSPVALRMAVDALSPTPDGRLVVHSGDNLVELTLVPAGAHRVLVVPKVIARVLPHASTLGSGVLIQNILGCTHVNLLSAPGCAPQLRVAELDGFRVLDAKYERGVMIATARRADSDQALAVRVTLQCTPDFRRFSVQTVADVEDPTVDFTVTDGGICVARSDEGGLLVFAPRPDATSPRGAGSAAAGAVRIVDGGPLGGAWLCRGSEGSVLAVSGEKLFRVRLAAGPAQSGSAAAGRAGSPAGR